MPSNFGFVKASHWVLALSNVAGLSNDMERHAKGRSECEDRTATHSGGGWICDIPVLSGYPFPAQHSAAIDLATRFRPTSCAAASSSPASSILIKHVGASFSAFKPRKCLRLLEWAAVSLLDTGSAILAPEKNIPDDVVRFNPSDSNVRMFISFWKDDTVSGELLKRGSRLVGTTIGFASNTCCGVLRNRTYATEWIRWKVSSKVLGRVGCCPEYIAWLAGTSSWNRRRFCFEVPHPQRKRHRLHPGLAAASTGCRLDG